MSDVSAARLVIVDEWEERKSAWTGEIRANEFVVCLGVVGCGGCGGKEGKR